ncbi:MAG: hypothetical protein P8100_03020 [bacterium]|jgi:hypothetical protein
MTRILIIILLAFNGLGAVYGGIMLISDPSGWKLGLPISLLEHSPFEDFLIPGFILFIVIGLGNLVVCGLVILRTGKNASWVIVAGFALAVWIAVQLLMIRQVHYLHIIYAFVGILLMILGIIDRKRELEGSD